MSPVSRRRRPSPWLVLLVVVATPAVGFGLPALLRPTVVRPPSPPARPAPLAADRYCGSGAVPAGGSSPSAPGPTLSSPLPAPREGEAMGYDASDDQVLVLGGTSFDVNFTDTATLFDQWALDASGWHQQLSLSPPPGAMAEDPGTGQVIMVSGSRSDGLNAETWSWDGRSWTRLADLPLSGDRVLGLAALGDRLVLITEAVNGSATHTWTWAGSTWALQHPAHELPPGAGGPLVSPDPAHHRIVALVQAAHGGELQTWAWGGSTWKLAVGTAPFGLDPITASMTADPQTGSVVLYMNPAGASACTWALSGSAWHQVAAASPAVDTEYNGAELLSDTRIGRVILVGGAARPDPLDVLWVLDGSTWSAEPASYLSG
jgi:hypothetical protein